MFPNRSLSSQNLWSPKKRALKSHLLPLRLAEREEVGAEDEAVAEVAVEEAQQQQPTGQLQQ